MPSYPVSYYLVSLAENYPMSENTLLIIHFSLELIYQVSCIISNGRAMRGEHQYLIQCHGMILRSSFVIRLITQSLGNYCANCLTHSVRIKWTTMVM